MAVAAAAAADKNRQGNMVVADSVAVKEEYCLLEPI